MKPKLNVVKGAENERTDENQMADGRGRNREL